MKGPARIVIVNWNGREWLGPCLSALKQQVFRRFETVVVDNGSTDGSVAYLRERFPDLRVVALETNTGFAAANNAGARGATSPYLVFLNNDTQVQPGWLDALVDTVERDPAIGLVTSNIVYMHDPDTVDSAGDGYLRCGGAFKHRHGERVDTSGAPKEVFGACGAAFLIRRDLFERLGGFDEDYFMVYEDVDLSYRARLAGARCYLAPAARVLHAGSASLGRVSANAVFYGQRNLEWTWIKNSPRSVLLRSLASHLLYNVAGLVAYAKAGQMLPMVKGKLAALAGIPRMLRKRRAVQRSAVVKSAELWSLMQGGWIEIKRREKRFDFRALENGRQPGGG